MTLLYPNNDLLKKYIKYFLFINNSDPTYKNTHISYPNTNHCLGLFKKSKIVQLSDYNLKVVQSNSFGSYLTGIYSRPLKFHYEGIFDEICIDFEPMGIEVLTGKKLSCYKFMNSVVEKFFNHFEGQLFSAAFGSDNPIERAESLESFFITIFSKQNEKYFIPFNDINVDCVVDLQDKFNLSYRSIHRIYKDNLSVSPKEFLSISKLRDSFLELRNLKTYTKHNYYDQSHLIKNYKKYTGLTPNNFKDKSTIIDNTVWLTFDPL